MAIRVVRDKDASKAERKQGSVVGASSIANMISNTIVIIVILLAIVPYS